MHKASAVTDIGVGQRMPCVEDITLQAMPPFVPAYKDQRLQDLAAWRRNSQTWVLRRLLLTMSRHTCELLISHG